MKSEVIRLNRELNNLKVDYILVDYRDSNESEILIRREDDWLGILIHKGKYRDKIISLRVIRSTSSMTEVYSGIICNEWKLSGRDVAEVRTIYN